MERNGGTQSRMQKRKGVKEIIKKEGNKVEWRKGMTQRKMQENQEHIQDGEKGKDEMQDGKRERHKVGQNNNQELVARKKCKKKKVKIRKK